MLRIIQTFDGHTINDGTSYRATILNPNSLPAAQPVFIPLPNADSEDAGTYTVENHTIAVGIKIVNYANRVALIAQLKTWIKRGTLGDLVVTFQDDSLNYSKPCRVLNLVQDPDFPMHFTALLSTGWTTWRAVTADTYNWNLTGSGGNHTVSLAGDDETPLSVTFELSAGPASGYLYQRFYQLINAPFPVPRLGYGPWCITIDTAALIADNANKCQVNSGAGIDAVVTTIPYDTVTGTVPSAGTGYVDTEQIRWTGKTGTTSGNLTGCTRGVSGTTAASHADNAVIRVSRMQANCVDLRIFVNGKETNRWIANPNNASTKVFFNIRLSQQGCNLPLRVAVDSSSNITSLKFSNTADVKRAVAALPAEGILVHGTEWIKFRKTGAPAGVGVTARGTLGSTKQAHSVGDNFQLMEHVIVVAYGNADSVNPATLDANYDNTKPLFVLTSSDNASWVYDATSTFYDLNGTGRTGGFTPSLTKRGDVSEYYNIKQDADSGDPAMGMKIGAYQQATGWASELAKIMWSLYRSCGISTTTITGQKYRTTTAWLSNVGLRKSTNGKDYQVVWDEATPGSATTWTALASHVGVSMGNARWMRFIFQGGYPAAASSYAAFEILTGTLAFVSANLPTGTLLSQQVSAQLDLTLTNGANGDELEAVTPMLVGLPLVLDGEAKTVLYHDVNAHDVITPNDESRDWWIRLQPGNNALTVAATVGDVGTLEAALSWYRRRF